MLNSPIDIANSFNTYFTSVGSNLAKLIPPASPSFESYLLPPPTSSAVFLPTTPSEIYNIINDLNSSSSCGEDGIPMTVIKSVSNLISQPLSLLINHSLNSGTYPNALKLAKVISIFKSGKKSDPANYRPIALLSNFSKIYEKVILSRMLTFIKMQNLLYENQFGFRANHTTELALIKLVDTITSAWDNNKYVCSVLIDLKKAFDTVDIHILLYKLNAYGFRGLPLQLISSYLQNRSKFVSVNNIQSQTLPITHGVPQGSVLGPLLFLIYINDIPNATPDSKPILFADDNTLTFVSSSPSQLCALVNNNLKSLHSWISANKLSLNLTKTHIINFQNHNLNWNNALIFNIDNHPIEQVAQSTILGVTLDQKLSFKPHIDTIQKKLSSALYIYSNIRDVIPSRVARGLYFSLFQSHINYCILVWGNACASYLAPLNILQHRILKQYLLLPKKTPSSELFTKAFVLSIPQLYQHNLARLIYKYLYCPSQFPTTLNYLFQLVSHVHQHATRASVNHNLYTPQSSSLVRQSSVVCQSPLTWNNVPKDIKLISSYFLFSKKLKSFLISHQ